MSLFISFAVENGNGREPETLGSTEHVLVLRNFYSKAHGYVVTVEVRVVTPRVEHEMSGTSLRFLMTTG